MLRTLPAVGHSIGITEIVRSLLPQATDSLAFPESLAPNRVVLPVNSGTAALTLALCGLKKTSSRRRVVLAAYGCPSVLSAVLHAGLEPVLCDVGKDDFRLDLPLLERLLDQDTLAVLAVHLYGVPENTSEIRPLVARQGVHLVEDAAQAFGRTNVGDNGGLCIWSFGRGKPLSALHGGAVVINDGSLTQPLQQAYRAIPQRPSSQEILAYLLSLVGYWALFPPRRYWIPSSIPWLGLGETVFSLRASNTRMMPLARRLGRAVRERFESIQADRSRVAQAYLEGLAPWRASFSWLPDAGLLGTGPLLRFPVIFQDSARRNEALTALTRAGLGGSRSYPRPLNELDGVKAHYDDDSLYLNARSVAQRILTLPLHSSVRERDVARIVAIVGGAATAGRGIKVACSRPRPGMFFPHSIGAIRRALRPAKRATQLLLWQRFRNPLPPTRPRSILFVCYGNICRSPFAEVYFRKLLADPGWRIGSAGLAPQAGRPSPPEAVEAAESLGVNLREHRSRPVDGEVLADYEMTFVMEPGQAEVLRQRFSHLRDRIFLLPLFVRRGRNLSCRERYVVEDPDGGSLEVFTACYEGLAEILVELRSSLS